MHDHGVSQIIAFIFSSVHGLVRGENMELGRDSDTGGQVNIIILLLVYR